MIVFPVTREQSANAARVAFHKIGVAGNIKTATAESIRSLLAKVESDRSIRERSKAMREAFHEAEREQGAVKLIEECLSGKLAVPHVVERESQRLRSARKLRAFSRKRETTADYGVVESRTQFLTRDPDLSKKTGA
jgi:hypothetical protein